MTSPRATAQHPPATRLSFTRLLPWAILCIGLAATYVLQDVAREATRLSRQGEFQFRVNEIAARIENRLHGYEQVLSGAAALFAASGQVERSEFRAYVGILKLSENYPGIQGVGFSRWVPPGEKAGHVAQVRRQGFPQYTIRPAGEREAYTSIIFLEPFDWRNQRAFGYDMYSEPVRRAAMARARDENATAISGKVTLVQETERDVQAGFLMYMPVYRNGVPHETPEARRTSLLGWTYAPFRVGDLMRGILARHFGEISETLDLEIYDGRSLDPAVLMFDSNPSTAKIGAAFQEQRHLPLFGHDWTVAVYSLPAFDARLKSEKAWLIGGAGVAVTLLLTLIAWLVAYGRSRELAMAEEEQRRLNRALRLLSDCNMALVRAEEEHKLLAEICRLIVERGGYLMAWIGFAENDPAKSVRPISQFGYETGYLDSVNITWADTERGQGPTGTAIRTRQTEVNQNFLANPKMAPWREAALRRGYQSSIALPLLNEEAVWGALMIYAREPFAFNPDEVHLLEELAGDLAYGIATLRTRAEHVAAEERLAFLAHYDPLTRLPNRLLLRDRFEQAIAAAQHDGSSVALLYLDLDNFKQINDSLGHEVGDRLLVVAVERLRQCLRDSDTISRLGGDEFAVLLPGVVDSATSGGIASKMLGAFAEPVTIDGNPLNTSFSIGISLYPDDGKDFDTLLKCADTAVNQAKESGRNTYRFFTLQMNRDALEQIRLQGQLHSAVRNGEFLLHYQPQMDIQSGRIIGAEALVRWQHPVEGLVSPARFIPLAEQTGHIVPLGEWVLNEACRQGVAWQKAGREPLVVAVNLSAIQFKRGNVLELVAAALHSSGLPPSCLELELTESILLQDIEATVQTLHGLKALGVKLSIDDFGTGYSSLSYLKRLAVDKLKIDQSFIRDLEQAPDDAAIVKAIIQLGHTLQLAVIAEGVETDAQLAFLRNYGCDEVQGYLFSRPVPAAQFSVLLESGRARPD